MRRRTKKKSLGNDVFGSTRHRQSSGTIGKILQGRRARREGVTREVELRIKLTPSNLKHLDALGARLEAKGKRRLSRNELIRAAITLLSVEDL